MNFLKDDRALAPLIIVGLLLSGALGISLFTVLGGFQAILPWDELILLVVIIILSSILVASIKFIQSRPAKAFLILVVGGAMFYFIMQLMGYLQ